MDQLWIGMWCVYAFAQVFDCLSLCLLEMMAQNFTPMNQDATRIKLIHLFVTEVRIWSVWDHKEILFVTLRMKFFFVRKFHNAIFSHENCISGKIVTSNQLWEFFPNQQKAGFLYWKYVNWTSYQISFTFSWSRQISFI